MYQRERSLPHFPSRGLFDPSLSINLCELAARSQTPISRLQQEELLLSFAQILLVHAEDRGTLPERGWEHPAVKQAKEYLHAYYAEEITLHALAHVEINPLLEGAQTWRFELRRREKAYVFTFSSH